MPDSCLQMPVQLRNPECIAPAGQDLIRVIPSTMRSFTAILGAEVAINIMMTGLRRLPPGGTKGSSDLERVDPSATVSYRRNPVIAEVFSHLKYMEKRGSGLRKIIEATSILPTYKEDRKPFFRSSRSFFFTTILNVNYGMDRAALESFADSRSPEPEYRPEDEIIISKTYPINQEPTQETYPDSSGVTHLITQKTAILPR